MKEIILIKNGELALKGLNRSTFEDVLIKNIRRRLRDVGEFEIKKSQSTITIEPKNDNFNMKQAVERLSKIFGIAGLSRAAAAEKNMDDILKVAENYLEELLLEIKTFKVEAKRADKKFPLKSPEICNEVGGFLLEKYPHLEVDVHNPQLTVNIEIRDRYAYIRGNQLRGAGGMPVSTAGRAALLVSGGIDSPVAGWMMSKRGVSLTAIHFASPPYTSQRAEQKVMELLQKVAEYSGRISTFVVPFTEIQEQIKDNCPEELFTIIMRRFMMRISEIIAKQDNCGALITGESLGQVASQTLYAIGCTDAVCTLPTFRPLIGMDKDEIVAISRKIDTFNISIQPFEDCCTVFTPKHPRTRPTLEYVEQAEDKLDIDGLVKRAVEATRNETVG
ncbi:MAG: tRNA uracil 4-sulfurtransferase ThiI [Oscillospiraceae bacterium]